MPVQRYTEHVITIRGSMDLTVTNDPLKVNKSRFFYVSNLRNDLIIEKSVRWEFLIFEKVEPYGTGLI